jgi:hypothetical protein
MKSLNSKMVATALAMVALLATPALAQKARKQHPAATHGQGIYNVVPNGPEGIRNGFGSTTVDADGRVIGADPDPQVRTQLLRDYGSSLGAY